MIHTLLYQPRKKRRVAVAFSAAVLIHVAAVAFAGVQQHKPVDETPTGESGCTLTFEPPEVADSTSPPDVPSPHPIANPTDDSFPEPHIIPPPILKQMVRSVTRIHRDGSGAPGAVSNPSTAKPFAVSAPRPEYPYEARRSKITGDGIVGMTIDPLTGNVTEVAMWQSTGSSYLDNAAISAFRRWRFKTGSVSAVRVPITFTLTGANY